MTAFNGAPRLEQDIGELAALPGLEAVSDQLAGLITVLRAEQARRRLASRSGGRRGRIWCSPAPRAPASPRRRGAGPPVSGPGPAAVRAPDRDRRRGPDRNHRPGHRDPGPGGHQAQRRPADDHRRAHLADPARPRPARARLRVPAADRGAKARRDDELAIILAGQAGPLRGLLAGQPSAGRPLPGRHRLPRLHPRPARRHLRHAGWRGRVPPHLRRQAQSRRRPGPRRSRPASGNARLAVRLLTQVTAARPTGSPRTRRRPGRAQHHLPWPTSPGTWTPTTRPRTTSGRASTYNRPPALSWPGIARP